MTTIDHFNLRSFDLNLLVAFDALVTEASVTKAARRLKIQQPAMSHALSTLRLLLQDDLFARVGQNMQPTPKALQLAGPVRQMLVQAQNALQYGMTFDPTSDLRTFTIGASPEVESLLLPVLNANCQRLAPGIRILSQMPSPEHFGASLDEGRLDLVIGCNKVVPKQAVAEALFDVEAACCFNPKLIDLPNPIPLDAYLAAPHALASQGESLQEHIRIALAAADVDLHVAMAPASFMSALAAAQHAPLIATVARPIAERFGPALGLDTSPVPIELGLPPVTMMWSTHNNGDLANSWLREQIRVATAETFPDNR